MSEIETLADLEIIVNLLLKCPSIKDRNQRDVIVGLLRREIKQAMPRHDVDRIDVISIVQTCANYAQGIEELSQCIRFVDGNTASCLELENFLHSLFPGIVTAASFEEFQQIISEIRLSEADLQRLYRKSAPFGWPSPAGIDTTKTISLMAKQLASAMLQADGTHPLLSFVEYLRLVVPEKRIRNKLKSWNDALAKELGVISQLDAWRGNHRLKHTSRKAKEIPPSQHHLLVKLQPDTLDKKLIYVDAWLVNDDENDVRHLHTEDVPRPLDTLSPLLNHFLSMSIRQIKDSHSNIMVELFLPLHFLCFDLDQWKVDIGLNKEAPLGHRYPVVLRSLDRAYSHHERGHEQLMRAWQIHWDNFQQALATMKPVFCQKKDYESRRNWQAFLEDTMCLALTFVPSTNDEQTKVSFLKEIIIAGNSVALWPRKQTGYLSEDEIQAMYHSLLARCNFSMLPEILWKKRKEALRNDDEQHLVHHLTLLWDNPNRLPPDVDLDQFVAPLKKGM
jgi:hypothetical protein